MKWILLLALVNGRDGAYTASMQEFESEATCRAAGAQMVKMTTITEHPTAKFECVKK